MSAPNPTPTPTPTRTAHRRRMALVSATVLVVSVGGIFWSGSVAVERERQAALWSNTAGRIRSQVEHQVNDVTLVAEGQRADPDSTFDEIAALTHALREGGAVPSLQGGGEVELAMTSPSPALEAKLRQQDRLVAELGRRSAAVLAAPAAGPVHDVAILGLRVVGAQLASVTSDVEGQITDDNQAAMERFSTLQAVLALVAAVAAIVAGRGFMRAGRRLEEARYRALAHHSSDLVLVTDPAGVTLRYVSPSMQRILGHDPAALVGTEMIDLVHPDDRELVGALLADLTADAGGTTVVEYRLGHADGRWCVVETGWSNLAGDSAVAGLVANGRDVSERRALEDELRHKAFRDDLTGLPNRALFADRVEQAVARSQRTGGAVTAMFVDLDDFKTVNDSLGHTVGDRLLVSVAQRIAGCLRSSDTAARLGGDEFGILLDDGSTIDTAESLAERVLGVLREPLEVAGAPLVVGASIGIACQRSPELTAEELLRDADVAMYVAKSQGKGRIEVFAPKMHDDVVLRQQLGTDLQMAMRAGELEVHYQPLVDLATARLVGVEALLRWNHPERGPVPPVVFIPIAEETGSMVEIGEWVLEQACEQLHRWSTRHPAVADLTMTVNLSPHQLVHRDLYDHVRRAITRTGIRPDRLVLEITEGAVIGDATATIAVLEHLRTLGVRLAIDDFGTGYSSLSQLRQLPIDMLKIDKSFVDDAADGGKGTALLHSIIELGRVLNLEILAEGIEDLDQADTLRASNAHLGQGYFYARPAAPADLEAQMAAGRVFLSSPEPA